MYVKPEVTRYSGKELLDLMGPAATQYAMEAPICDISPSTVEYDSSATDGSGDFQITLTDGRCDNFADVTSVIVVFDNDGNCDQDYFGSSISMSNGDLIIDGVVTMQLSTGCGMPDGASGLFDVDVLLVYNAAPDCEPACQDDLEINIDDVAP